MKLIPTITDKSTVSRFWNKVDIKEANDCWNWIGSTIIDTYGSGGYGLFWDGIKVIRAHRYSWELSNGPIPKGKLILHKCDNRKCVNPFHLRLGTHSDNMYDRIKRNPNNLGGQVSKLYEGEAWLMKKLYKSKKVTQSQIAKMFKCSQRAVSEIITDKTTHFKEK